ncbi:E3 ubiquitin-protein ligase BRE1B [Chelonia mydas]|uniref:E3 ubiquitin protein ligase n=1 Tax=Chelonia mydas TaxID=8469 RepID=M7AMM4_CHEMY|nr:E3 ubiquitin-protein ligase BRE1B [Chelonia mydas]
MSGPGSKRAAGDGGSGPPEKKANREEKTTTTLIEPIRLGGISSTEEMDLKVLQFKNKKLAERLEQRQAFEDELRERIEKLEKRQATDDATLLIVNRYWSQLDENVQVLLRGYDGDCEPPPPAAPAVPSAEEPRPEPTGPDPENTASPSTEGPDRTALSFLATLASSSSEEIELQLQERMEFSKAAVSRVVEVSNKIHRRTEELCQKIHARADLDQLDEALKSLNKELMRENQRLQDLAMQLQEKHHKISLEYTELQDKVTSSETKVLEMETTVEDLQWDIEKLRKREQKLNKHLAEALEQLNSGYYVSGSSGGFQGGQITLSMQKFEMLNAELEENQELANSRMAELEKLQQELQQAVRTNEKLKVTRWRAVPPGARFGGGTWLQSQFSLLYNESLQVKTQLDEARALLLTTKNSHLRHIEHMESDELNLQKKLRTEVIQLEDTLAQVRKEYEMLRIEFEQNLAANEQAGPINREMRHLISSLQNHNHQLKGDVQRYKRKLREVQAEINKIRMQSSGFPCGSAVLPPAPGPEELVGVVPAVAVKEEEGGTPSVEKSSDDPKKKDSDLLKQLRIELKKAQESQKEMKLLLDMYKSAPKEQRDKVQLMAAEKKTKAEVEELRGRVRELEEKEKKESKKMADEDALRKIKLAEEQIEHLQKKLAATKQEEEALLSEMDVTGQAFEDMQEQNMRLMQQLREKDDANFKLMSERIKSNQIHKLLREEKDELADQVLALKSQAVEAAQLAEDLKVQQEHVQCKLKEIQACMAENRAAKEKESFNLKRAQEDISRLRRKLEKQKKVEVYADADEILQEEIKEYKAKLTCPCCNTRKKDAVLTKCFHVFCFDCVKTRYDTRQRKCPKCNAAFGANDFHRIYIS